MTKLGLFTNGTGFITVPKAVIQANGWTKGMEIEIRILGDCITAKPKR